MKKSLLSVFAVAAGLLMATSCSNEREEVQSEGEAVVSFVAELPRSMVNRAPSRAAAASAFGDGTTATHLSYAVYEVNGDNWTMLDKLSRDTTLTDLKTTIKLNLSNGKTYAVAFWADATNSIYAFDKATYKITANYTDVVSSDENLDAFYAVKTLTVNGASQQSVELRRPFAQLNIGTGDLQTSADANHEVTKAAVTAKVYSQLNLKNGEVEGEAAEVTFALADLPTVTFPIAGYNYLAMNYLLVSADKSSDNAITIRYDEASGVDTRTFENVPLQRNYRTNIYGNLLTNTTEFDVEVNPDFDGTQCTVSTTAELKEALAAGVTDIQLAAGTYYLKGLTLTADATISGTDAATTIVSLQLADGDPSYGEYYMDARGHKLTFNNVTYSQTGNGIYAIMEHNGTSGTLFADELVMNNCICNGTLSIVADKATLKGCTVNNDRKSATQGYPIIVFGNDNCKVLLDNCTVNGVTKGIMLYAYDRAYTYDLTVKDCNFVSTLADDKAAIELHTEGGIKGYLTITNTTWSGFPTHEVYNGGLWHEIVNQNSATDYGNAYGLTKRFNVTVDGTSVQTQDLTYKGAANSALPQ